MRSALRAGALALAATALSLAGAEILARALEPESVRLAAIRDQFAFFKHDPSLGWRHIPGLNARFTRHEFDVAVRTNSQGLRGPEIAPKHGPRLAVLGDSFTWGHGVEEHERFSDLLALSAGLDVVNFGMLAYGPVQYLLQLEEVLEAKPDAVLIALCPENDPIDSLTNFSYGRYRPYAALSATGELETKGTPVPTLTRFGNDLRPWYLDLALGRIASYVMWGSYGFAKNLPPENGPKIEGLQNITTARFYREEEAPDVKTAMNIQLALLKAIDARMKQAGIPWRLFILPTKPDLAYPQLRLRLAHAIREEGIKVIGEDITVPPELYYISDSHWRPAGHETVAQALSPVIRAWLDESSNE